MKPARLFSVILSVVPNLTFSLAQQPDDGWKLHLDIWNNYPAPQ